MANLTVYSGAPAASGDNTLIAAPGAGLRIVVDNLLLQNNVATANTALLYDGASSTGTKLLTLLLQNQGDGFASAGSFLGDDGKVRHLKLAANKALVLNLSAATTARR